MKIRGFGFVLVLIASAGIAAAQDLVQNGSFAADLSGWNVHNDALSNADWASPDAGGSGSSGSVFITDTSAAEGTLDTPIEQCITVLPGAQYVLSSKFFIPSGQAATGWIETEIFWVSIGPSDVSRFRYNIGIRTLDTPVSVSIVVRDSAGNTVHSHVETYPAEFYTQKSASDFLGGFDLGNDQSIFIFFSGGGAIIYGATTDNVTNDPSVQFLPYLGAIA